MTADVAGWCGWCGAPLEQLERGRTRLFCSDSHRAAAHRWRTRLRACGLVSEVCRREHGVLHRWSRP